MKKEVSIIELKSEGTLKYKVTCRIPDVYTSETKIFKTKKAALLQFRKWLK